MRIKNLLYACFILFLLLSCAGVKQPEQVHKHELESSEKPHEFPDDMYDAYYHFTLSRMKIYDRDLPGSINELELALKSDPDSPYLKYNLALLYLVSDKMEKAIETLESAIKSDPDYVPPYKVLGKLYAASDDDKSKEKAEDILKKAVALDPGDYESNLLLGVYYIDRNNYEEAKKYLRRSIGIKPSDIKSHYYLAEVLREQGKLSEAEKIYSEILDIDPDNYATLLTLSVIYENLGNPARSESCYKKLLNKYHDSPIVYEEYGSFLYRNNRLDEAVTQFENAEVYDSNDSDIKLKLGILYVQKGMYAEALRKLNYVLQQQPDNDSAIYYTGVCMLNMGKTGEARKIFKQIGTGSDYYNNAVFQLARIHENNGETALAVDMIVKQLEKDPQNATFANYLGQLYRKQDRYDKAISLYQNFLNKDPGNESIIYSLGVAYFYNGQEDKSIETMRSLLSVNPEHADAMNFIGYTYTEKGVNLDEAEKFIRKAMQLSPDSGYIVDSLGWLYYQRGDYDKALEYIKQASDMSSEDPAIKEHLGDVYMKKADRVKALENYGKALSLLKNNDMDMKENLELKNRLEKKIEEIYKSI